MKRLHTLAAAFALAFAGTAAAQDKPVELKFSHWVPPTHAMHKTIQAWAASIDKASNGTIKVSIFPAQQLGKAFDHYDMTQSGIADVAYINVGYQAGRLPVANAIQLPFLVSEAGNGSRAFDEWYRKYAAKDMPGVKMCLMFIHDPGTLHSKVKITSTDQLKGMKVRPAHAMMADWMKSLGATTVTLSAPESREALERGVADAITFPWESIYLFGIDKVTKFHIDEKLYATGFAWIVNPAKYEAMSPGQKKVIDDHCNSEWAYRVGKEWGDYEAAGRERMKADKSHTVTALSPAELAAWKKSAEPVTATWAAEVSKAGYDPNAVLNELKATLAKNKAGL
ncbi:MAG: TRAP transporter substrate-binding protein [Burkholderiales bacterium]|jgi:TRAP-type C4-dicarboxylate transport system substrate-binding protein|nr:TRAP transporter substrate-binding protein [Burkholderiales bacterium]